MLDGGFVRVAAVTPEVSVADCEYNAEKIEEAIKEAVSLGAKIICTPELSITGYTCGDLFLQETLVNSAFSALKRLLLNSVGREEIAIVGLPFSLDNKLYNVAAVYSNGKLHGVVPKTHIPNHGEYYEKRHFVPSEDGVRYITLGDADDIIEIETGYVDEDGDEIYIDNSSITFGSNIIFQCEEYSNLRFAVEICEDLWVGKPPSTGHARAGANIICNLSAGNETIGKAAYRRMLTSSQSGRSLCGYVYANAGFGESTTDMVFSGHSIIAENGTILSEKAPFTDGIAIADIDLAGIVHDRLYMTTFSVASIEEDENYTLEEFSMKKIGSEGRKLYRDISSHPFVPSEIKERKARCEDILNMQSAGLATRLIKAHAKTALIGISGGLDSTLALIVSARAVKKVGLGPDAVKAVTMPSFGTTERTKGNAYALCEALGVTLKEIDITSTVKEHLDSIEHEESNHDVAFENSQARIRTLVLMDLANMYNGLVVGTGDLSELALGWATYNGDHMSMYGVNAGVPKTLVRHIISYVADDARKENPALSNVLEDILATPVSPELLPPKEGEMSQMTEEIIGPYELHDFFLYHMIRWGRSPRKIIELAKQAFCGPKVIAIDKRASVDESSLDNIYYDEETILKWIRIFYKRFFASQFKRSALPDGPKIGSVSLSPRGDWRMPSDAQVTEWLKDIDSYLSDKGIYSE